MKRLFLILLLLQLNSIELLATEIESLHKISLTHDRLLSLKNKLRSSILSVSMGRTHCFNKAMIENSSVDSKKFEKDGLSNFDLDLNTISISEKDTQKFSAEDPNIPSSSLTFKDKTSPKNSQTILLSNNISCKTYSLSHDERDLKIDCFYDSLTKQEFYAKQCVLFEEIRKFIDEDTLNSFSKLSGSEIFEILKQSKNITPLLESNIRVIFHKNNYQDLEFSPYW